MKKILNNAYFHIIIAILSALIVYTLVPGEVHPKAPLTASMIILMAVLWITEAIPIPVTSLIPLFFLPFIGVASVKDVSPYYARSIVFLFLGGFLLALALQRSGIHKRIALHIVHKIGSKPSRIVLGFMIATGFLSMWISNTASVMVMLPVGLSVIHQAKASGLTGKDLQNFGLGIMLGMAYSADIGGMATVIGTPPNLVFIELFQELFPEAPEVSFIDWMMMGLPMTFVFMTIGWILLTKIIFRVKKKDTFGGNDTIKSQLSDLGKLTRDELFAGLVFSLTALLWMTGSDIKLGEVTIYGWRTLLDLKGLGDAGIAIMMATVLFLIPSKDRKGHFLLDWEMTEKVPWGILLLFGGGFALAFGFEKSGLGQIVGEAFSKMDVSSPVLAVAVINTVLTFLTEITSNTAMTNLILPVLAEASVSLNIDPRIFMIPATLSASCAFMMPIASPTQAIVFGSGYVPIRKMMQAGIWFNLIGIFLVTLFFLILGQMVLGIDIAVVPEWVN
jgi:sodium-dependent dicarboxylate transporter 2/3/5